MLLHVHVAAGENVGGVAVDGFTGLIRCNDGRLSKLDV